MKIRMIWSLDTYIKLFIIKIHCWYRMYQVLQMLMSVLYTTALCINCRSIWKQVMKIYRQSRNRLYCRDAHVNRIRLIAQPYYRLIPSESRTLWLSFTVWGNVLEQICKVPNTCRNQYQRFARGGQLQTKQLSVPRLFYKLLFWKSFLVLCKANMKNLISWQLNSKANLHLTCTVKKDVEEKWGHYLRVYTAVLYKLAKPYKTTRWLHPADKFSITKIIHK